MAYNLLSCERDQSYLMPPSMRDWLSEGHLAWFIVDAVGQMDLREFYAVYRSDGWGAAAYDPGMMVAILLYGYCVGVRSSRRIARALEEDVGFRVVAANRQPDFRTICRFRAERAEAFEELFVEVLRLCHEAGLVKLGVVALDGTKVAANAALATNRSHQAIEEEVRRMLAEAKAMDAEEDANYGPDRRGDELPEGLGGRTERLKRLKEAKERLQREAEAGAKAVQEHVERRRAEEEATGKKKRGRKPKVVEPLPTEEAKANTTDPDSRIMKTRQGYVQGYNAQAVVSEEQIIVAVGVTQEANGPGCHAEAAAGLADAGYWSEANIRACPSNPATCLPTRGTTPCTTSDTRWEKVLPLLLIFPDRPGTKSPSMRQPPLLLIFPDRPGTKSPSNGCTTASMPLTDVRPAWGSNRWTIWGPTQTAPTGSDARQEGVT